MPFDWAHCALHPLLSQPPCYPATAGATVVLASESECNKLLRKTRHWPSATRHGSYHVCSEQANPSSESQHLRMKLQPPIIHPLLRKYKHSAYSAFPLARFGNRPMRARWPQTSCCRSLIKGPVTQRDSDTERLGCPLHLHLGSSTVPFAFVEGKLTRSYYPVTQVMHGLPLCTSTPSQHRYLASMSAGAT